jgi:multidrug resistance efflux pump
MNIEEEIKKEEKFVEKVVKKSFVRRPWFGSVLGMIIIVIALVVFIFWRVTANEIKIDTSSVSAPIIDLSPTTLGVLEDIYVKDGDTVEPNTPVALVGSETITSKVGGVIVSVNHQEGQVFTPGEAVVSMINLDQERIVGKIDENKGLSRIKVGQKATFTIDAYGSKQFEGIVDEVSPISDQSGVLFNISDQRPVMQFDIKVRFDTQQYSFLKEGMSAKITIYTN